MILIFFKKIVRPLLILRKQRQVPRYNVVFKVGIHIRVVLLHQIGLEFILKQVRIAGIVPFPVQKELPELSLVIAESIPHPVNSLSILKGGEKEAVVPFVGRKNVTKTAAALAGKRNNSALTRPKIPLCLFYYSPFEEQLPQQLLFRIEGKFFRPCFLIEGRKVRRPIVMGVPAVEGVKHTVG